MGKAIEQTQQNEQEFTFACSADADLRDLHATRNLFRKVNPHWVIHLAARVGGVFANIEHNLEFFEDNLAINRNIVTLCHEWKIQRAVFCLSTCIFPASVLLPMVEEHLHGGPPHTSNEGYAYAKRMLECQVRYYRETFGYSRWMCVSPTNVYGPFDNFHHFNSHVLPSLIRQCVERVNTKAPTWVVCGTGTPRRQFIYSMDLARIILQLIRNEQAMANHLICADSLNSEISISELAIMVADALGFTGSIVFDTSKTDGISRKTVANHLLLRTIPNIQFTPLAVGIAETCDWFQTTAILRI